MNDKVVVFRKYNNGIDANMAKTKLDVFGIPCFLSGENLNALYPLTFLGSITITLHVFERDLTKVSEVLDGTIGLNAFE